MSQFMNFGINHKSKEGSDQYSVCHSVYATFTKKNNWNAIAMPFTALTKMSGVHFLEHIR